MTADSTSAAGPSLPTQEDGDGLRRFDRFETHPLKVEPPYFGAVVDGTKPFEVRRNDRGFQRGDFLLLHEWHPAGQGDLGCHACRNRIDSGHYTGRRTARWVTYVYAGDPRFGGVEAGMVVLGLGVDEWCRSHDDGVTITFVSELIDQADSLEAALEAAEAQRDAALAKIAAVEAVVNEADLKSFGTSYDTGWDDAAATVRAALAGPS